MITLVIIFALLLDRLFSETPRFHPLVGFGLVADKIEKRLNIGENKKTKGVIAVALAIAPIVSMALLLEYQLQKSTILGFLFSSVVLYVAIGWRSLILHAKRISTPLARGQIEEARLAVSMIVSRDTDTIGESDIAKAATESVLENGADAIFSAIFWFCILGVPGVILYRLSNTLDAMWGYKNNRYKEFGWAAARFDDILNFIPARLTALGYSLLGDTRLALQCWRTQGFNWKSPNAGPVMAAGAGALNVSLGGVAQYENQTQLRPALGPVFETIIEPVEPIIKSTSGHNANTKAEDTRHHPRLPSAKTIDNACTLINKSLIVWLLCIAGLELIL